VTARTARTSRAASETAEPSATSEAAEAFTTASRALVGIAIRSINAAAVDLTLPQHRVLVVLAAEGPQGIGQLAEQLGVDQSNASRICDRLQRLDLVARRRSSTDGRAVLVHLTNSGAQVLRAVNSHRHREVARVLAAMPPEAVSSAVAALNAFSDAARETRASGWSMPEV
jgi:DNA-binding MarR family transcriptional regulator